MRKFSFVVAGLVALATFAADLDYRAAERAYRAQEAVTQRAKQRLDYEASRIQAAQSALSQAQSEEQNSRNQYDAALQRLNEYDNSISSYEQQNVRLQNDIQNLEQQKSQILSQLQQARDQQTQLERNKQHSERELQIVRRRISELESQPNSGAWTCVYRDKGQEEHNGGHRSTDTDRTKADADAKALCLTFHGECRLARCTQPDSTDLAQLRQREQTLISQVNDISNQLNSTHQQISNLEYQQNDLQNRIANNLNQIRQNEATLSSLHRDRDRQLLVISDAQTEWRNAQAEVRTAQNNLTNLWPAYQYAESELRTEEARLQTAYAYYQQVLANYNAALSEVYAKADRAADIDANNEALARAPQVGKADGKQQGKQQGTDKAFSDGSARERRAGYIQGQASATSDPALTAFYQNGIGLGESLASKKATAENFPEGYNQALKALMAGNPAKNSVVDVSESISSAPGGNGVLLDLRQKVVGSVAGPTIATPSVPALVPPSFATPGVSVPAALNLNFNPPCTGLILAEFEPLCQSRYKQGYQSRFYSNYTGHYVSSYRPEFETEAKNSYEKTLAQTFAAAFTEGTQMGARAQGTLDGFAKILTSLQASKTEEGKAQLQTDRLGGALLVIRGATLEEVSGDGVFTPGEKTKLTITVDNYGLQETALEKLRLTVKAAIGATNLNFTVRNLPALEANTRTTLTGIVAADISTRFPKDLIQLSTKLEAEVDGQWKVLSELSPSAETHFPLEVTEMTLPKNPKVDEVVAATFTIKNHTRSKSLPGKMGFESKPGFVAFEDKEAEISELEAGEVKDIALRIKPGNWVPENSYVTFVATKDGAAQSFAKNIQMNRNLGLLLFDSAGRPVPSSTLRVKAGTTFGISPKAIYHAKQSLPGPFSIGTLKTSNTGITIAGGSTTGIQYGGLSPNYTLTPMKVYYTVSPSLKGKKEWVMLHASEGNKVLHALMVYLEIE